MLKLWSHSDSCSEWHSGDNDNGDGWDDGDENNKMVMTILEQFSELSWSRSDSGSEW